LLVGGVGPGDELHVGRGDVAVGEVSLGGLELLVLLLGSDFGIKG